MNSLPAIRSHARNMEIARFITKEAERLAGKDDPHALLDQKLAQLAAEEPRSIKRIGNALGDMAEARAELLASPLHADDPTAPELRLSALNAARRYRDAQPLAPTKDKP